MEMGEGYMCMCGENYLSFVLHCSFGSHEQLELFRAKILMKYVHILTIEPVPTQSMP